MSYRNVGHPSMALILSRFEQTWHDGIIQNLEDFDFIG